MSEGLFLVKYGEIALKKRNRRRLHPQPEGIREGEASGSFLHRL